MSAWRTALVLACATIQAQAQEAPPSICAPGDVVLFSCVLRIRQQAALCLAAADLKLHLVVRAGGTPVSSPVRNLLEATIGGNGHGDIVALQGDTKDGPFSLYVDFIADDLLPPVLVVGSGKQVIKESCASPSFEAPSSEIRVGGVLRPASLGTLQDLGVAKPLTPVPDWPD